MSKIRVDEIVNKTDDGSPSFPQGATTIEPTADSQVATKSYVDNFLASDHGSSVSTSAPANPGVGSFWTDTSSIPNILNVWDGSNWVAFSGTVDNISYLLGIATPAVLTPTDNEQNVNPGSVTLTSSAPESFIVGREQTSSSVISSYSNAEWQIAEDSGFTTNVQTLTSPLNTTGTHSGPVGFDIGFDTDYYVRTKYSSSTPSNVVSDWSSANTFKTSVFVNRYWLSLIGGSNTDMPRDIAVNSTNQYLPTIYFVGYNQSDSYNYDYNIHLVKLNSLGNVLWKRRLKDPSYNYHDYAHGVATDSSDNAYICGQYEYYQQPGGSTDKKEAFVAKYDPSGNVLWKRGIGGGSGGLDQYLMKLKVDSSGNIYAVGRSRGDLLVVKLDSSGNMQWYRTYHDTEVTTNAANSTSGNGIHIDSSGDIYIAGSGYVVSTVDENGNQARSEAYAAYLWKLNSNGDIIWQRRVRTPWQANYGNSVIADDSGNVYLSGTLYVHGRAASSSYSTDCLLVKYDSSGNMQWHRTAKTSGSGRGGATGVVLDNSGNIYVSATYHNGSSPRYLFDPVLLKYDSSGALQFTRRFGGDQHDYSAGIAIDALGSLYLSGREGSELTHGGTTDMMMIKVPNDGTQTGTWSEISYVDASNLISDSTSEAPITEDAGTYTESSQTLSDYDMGFVSEESVITAATTILNP